MILSIYFGGSVVDKRIAVIGAGSWGTAMAIHMARHGYSVSLIARDAKKANTMQSERLNATYLPRHRFPELLTVTADLPAAVQAADVVMLMLPSPSFNDCLAQIKSLVSTDTLICWGCKGLGLQQADPKFLHEIFISHFGPKHPMAVVGGPSFAKEVAQAVPTAIVVASSQQTACSRLIAILHHENMRCYSSPDILGVELCGVLKNILAVAAGISDGLTLGANSRSALITRGLAEMQRLANALGARAETLMGLAGVGDVVLSCTSDLSRNRRLGLGLGRGENLSQVMAEIGQVVESNNNINVLLALASQHGVSLPITEQVAKVVTAEKTPEQAMKDLMARRPVAEL